MTAKKKFKGYRIHPLDGEPTVVNRMSIECFRHEDVCDEDCDQCLFDVTGGSEKQMIYLEWEKANA